MNAARMATNSRMDCGVRTNDDGPSDWLSQESESSASDDSLVSDDSPDSADSHGIVGVGADLEPETLIKQLRLSGPAERIVFLTHVLGEPWALIGEKA